MAGLVNAANKVPEYQRMYQAAYKNHTRIWKIHPRSTWIYTPFVFVMWGSTACCLYMMGRKAAGYNTWFGKK